MTERAFDKIKSGLQDALAVTRLANEILDLLPPAVVTKDLHSRIIAALAQHVDGSADTASQAVIEAARHHRIHQNDASMRVLVEAVDAHDRTQGERG